MFKTVSSIFLRGLTVLLPIAAAAYVIKWLIMDTEGALKGLILEILPEEYYVPGMGLALLIAIIFGVGVLMYPWITRKLLDGLDTGLREIPLISLVYSPVRDLMEMFGEGGMTQELGKPVLVKLPNTEVETLGFITRENLSNLPDGLNREGHVVVYVQWSSQIGGYCFIVPKSSVRELDMSVEDGMRWALTAGLSGPKERHHQDSSLQPEKNPPAGKADGS